MIDIFQSEHQINCVNNFQDFIATPFQGDVNAIGWKRNLIGDFSEIVQKVELKENITVIDEEQLRELQLTEQGQFARTIILNDIKLLTEHGANPTLNLIKHYERDDYFPLLSTDVYSFHVDRSDIPADTFLCTYFGESSEILPNNQAIQKVQIPEIRHELKKLYGGDIDGFEDFLSDNFFDLHYQALPQAHPISLGIGHLWRLAIEHPYKKVLPCIHRAPIEMSFRLLLICNLYFYLT